MKHYLAHNGWLLRVVLWGIAQMGFGILGLWLAGELFDFATTVARGGMMMLCVALFVFLLGASLILITIGAYKLFSCGRTGHDRS